MGKLVTYLAFDDETYYDSARKTNWVATGSHISLNATGGYDGKGYIQFTSNNDSYLSSTSIPLANNDFEISFWAKNLKSHCPPTGISNIYVNDRYDANVGDFCIGINESNHLALVMNNDWAFVDTSYDITVDTNNTWVFIKFLRNKDSIQIYVNGTKRGELTTSKNYSFPVYSGRSEIGTLSGSFLYDSIDGMIDDFKITISPRGTYVIKNLKQY
jgi:hypothetical protein